MVATFPIVIEDMTLDDIDGVQEVERASFPVPWPANAFRHELTQNKNARYLVAREGGRIVGYAGLWLMVDEAHITTFAVHPDSRRQRIGERLLVRVFELAAALNAEWLTLEVRASNLAAQKLYEKYGFRRAGVRRRYYSDNNEDAQVLARSDLRNDPTGVLVHELRRDDVRADAPAVFHDRDAGLIARRLDREDPQRSSWSSAALSFASRSRTARSRRRSVHMISASSLLSE